MFLRNGCCRSRGMKRAALAWLTAATVLLAGCGMLPERISPEPAWSADDTAWQAHALALSRLRSWTMQGALIVRSSGDTSRVTMQWRQTGDSYRVRFNGPAPFGVGLFEVEGSEAGVKARFADGRRVRAESPEALLEREVGWSVPLAGLRYWLVGAPAPDGAPSETELDGRGRLARLEQAGWTLIYERYGNLGDLALPERIRFSGESVEATVVVRRWRAERDPV